MSQAPINTDVVGRIRSFHPTTGLPYTPDSGHEFTVQVVRHNENQTQTELVAAGTETTQESDTSVATYKLVAASQTALGTLEMIFTSTDPVLTPYGEGYSVRRVFVEVERVAFTLSEGVYKVNSIDDHLDDEIAAILAQTNLISAGNVTYSAPVNPNTQSLALNQSQDYLAADGGQLPEWSSTAWTPFSLTTAASVTWYIRDFDGTLRSGAVNVVSDTELDVRTFANAVTALLTPGDDPKRRVQVWAILDVAHGSAHKKLVDAKVTVSDDIRN